LVNGYLSPYYSSNIATATYDLAPAKLTANRSITGTATQIDNLNLIGVGQTAGNPTTAPGSSGSGNSQVGSIPTQIPTNALYSLDAAPGSHYLVETDPAFANYKSWLSSDYMLQTLSLDPALTQKRLGDGYYEQQLVREQVAQLTGRRFLNGYTSDEAEYQSLMNAGVTYAQAHQLVPGIALSAEQVAQLTSDIVWLVDKEVTLPDGSTTHALVPQVYVKLQAGDLNSNGSLIGGDAVNLQVSGNITNNGTIAGRNVLSLTAENINNEGGTISGAVASLAARADINNIGGQISGTDSLTVSAGHNLNVSSTTVDYQAGSANYRNATTTVARTAGLYVTGASGTLLASAGNDINLVAAAIDSKGTAQIQAGNNLNIGTVATRSTLNTDRDADNYEHRTSTSEAGSTITSQRNLSLIAGTDLTVRAATISSTNGGIGFTAGQDINLLAGQATQTMDAANKDVSGGFFSSKTTIDRTSTYDTYALGSTASGNTVTAVAGRDLTVKGSNVVGGQGVTLAAGNQLTVSAAAISIRKKNRGSSVAVVYR